MRDALLASMLELLRETFEGGLPGQGTQYLDHASGIRSTLMPLTAEQASRSRGGHPTIAAHVRHMSFHLRVAAEWIQGERPTRDWLASFEPQRVTDEEWARLKQDIEASRAMLERALEGLSPDALAEDATGMGAIAHLAYHLGAIRQLAHDV